ncbi:unnamed protein product [Mytilus edulis]|uniref:Uncharacterized protein n=1 Tax=Mytilus edulis TaxID=6550 RepID=A0A8S3UUL2_MYTED|nr:unnamed protein product [Mytilus edulis]
MKDDFGKLNLREHWDQIFRNNGVGIGLKFPVRISHAIRNKDDFVPVNGVLKKQRNLVERLRITSSTAEIGSVKGRQRINLLSKCTVVSIFKSELLDVRCYEIKLCKLDEKKIELEKKCRVLSEKLSKENEMANIISEQNLDIYALQEKNSYLANYIQKLESQLPNVQTEKDIDIDTLKPKTRQRTLKKLETEAQRALWFAETFGLTPKSLTMTSKRAKIFLSVFKKRRKATCHILHQCQKRIKKKLKTSVFAG